MATMKAFLPDVMKEWVAAQAETGRYANSGDDVAAMQRFVDEGPYFPVQGSSGHRRCRR
jgi:antitoxin ParD1/3/4